MQSNPHSTSVKGANRNSIRISFSAGAKATHAQDGSLSIYFSKHGNTKCYARSGSIFEIEGGATNADAKQILIITREKTA